MTELLWPLKSSVVWVLFPTWLICSPGTSGRETLAGLPPSNVSDNVAPSPSVTVSRSSDAVNDVAKAGPQPSATNSSTANVFKVNRIIFSSILTDGSRKCSSFFNLKKAQNHLPTAAGKSIMAG